MGRYKENEMIHKPCNHVILAALKGYGGSRPHVNSIKSMQRAATVLLQKGGECT